MTKIPQKQVGNLVDDLIEINENIEAVEGDLIAVVNDQEVLAEQFATLDSKFQGTLTNIRITVPDEVTALSTGTGKMTIRAPYPMEIKEVRLTVTENPTGAALIADVKSNGTSLFFVKPQVDAGADTSVGSATPYIIANNFVFDNAKLVLDITQIGSTLAGKGLKVDLIGYQKTYDYNSLLPDFNTPFSQWVAKYKMIKNFDFGTGKVSDGTNTPITNSTALQTWFRPKSDNANLFVINKEIQDYQQDMTNADNFAFTADTLDLTATFVDPATPGKLDFNPTANVTNSFTIPLADTTNIPLNSVVGFGADAMGVNMFRNRTHSIRGTLTVGDTVTTTISTNTGAPVDQAFSLAFTATADANSTYDTLAQNLVDQINADATCQLRRISAYKVAAPGAYGVNCPMQLDETQTSVHYRTGSIRAWGSGNTKTGTVLHETLASMRISYVVSKTANSITINHPVTLTTSSTVTVSKARCIPIQSKTTGQFNVTPGLEAGLEVGQIIHMGYNDNNCLPITSISSGVIGCTTGSGFPAGHMIVICPTYRFTSVGSVTNSPTVTVATVPAGIKAGMVMRSYFGDPYSNGIWKVVSTTSTTITFDVNVTWANGTTFIIQPAIMSAQIWSRFCMAPGMDYREFFALEASVKNPTVADIAAFPAFWTFDYINDPYAVPGSPGTTEVDYSDNFNYFNNDSTNNFVGAGGSSPGGTAQAGSTTTTIVLAANAHYRDGAYVGMNVRTTSGTGSGQTRKIIAYNGTTKVATVETAWTTTPGSNTVYVLEAVVLYTNPNYGSGNNLGYKDRKIQHIATLNRTYFYIDDELMICRAATWGGYRRGQFAVNLAIGSLNTGLFQNGYYPIDQSRFPIKFKIKHVKFWSTPNTKMAEII